MGAIDNFNENEQKIKSIDSQIRDYEKLEVIKEYKKLIKDRGSLIKIKRRLYPDAKYEEYDACDHLVAWVYGFSNNRYRDNYYHNRLCVKCGLTTLVKDYPRHKLNDEQKIMYDYFSKRYKFYKPDNELLDGTDIMNSQCDPALAVAIYREIIKLYSDIDEEKAKELFDKTVDEVKSLKNEKDKKAYAKKLGLDFKSIRW